MTCSKNHLAAQLGFESLDWGLSTAQLASLIHPLHSQSPFKNQSLPTSFQAERAPSALLQLCPGGHQPP